MHETGKEDCIMNNLQEKLCNTKESVKMVLANLIALVSKIVLCYLSFLLFLFVLMHIDGVCVKLWHTFGPLQKLENLKTKFMLIPR